MKAITQFIRQLLCRHQFGPYRRTPAMQRKNASLFEVYHTCRKCGYEQAEYLPSRFNQIGG